MGRCGSGVKAAGVGVGVGVGGGGGGGGGGAGAGGVHTRWGTRALNSLQVPSLELLKPA